MGVAFVTGITGQDGGYLAEHLLGSGWVVHGLIQRWDDPARQLAESYPELVLHECDLQDTAGVARTLRETRPSEVYNLGGISSVALSWSEPVLTAKVSGLSVAHLLEECWRLTQDGSPTRFLQASSAEIFGDAPSPQNERTSLRPRSPYGAAKAFAHHLVGVYRSRGMFAVGAILYNHESPRRPPTFVTRKITRAVAAISLGMQDEIVLGNMDAGRDWGWAPDYVEAMVRAVRHSTPNDYVIATGQLHTVRDLVAEAFRVVGIDDWDRYVRVDPELLRPQDPGVLLGDASLARRELGWEPSVSFAEVISAMVNEDLRGLQAGR